MQSRVEIVIGSIVEEEADVIVNSANTGMIMGGGVAAAILHEAGPEVEEEAIHQAPVAVGEIVVTSAGNLAAQNIVHVAVVGEAEPDLYECTSNVLDAAANLGARTLAMPALGTGSAGISPSAAANDIFRAIRDHLKHDRGALQIRIVLWDDEIYLSFQRAMERFLPA